MNVLDASALLAFLQGEQGAQSVASVISGGIVAAPNWSEVLQKVSHRGGGATEVAAKFRVAGLLVEPMTEAEAVVAARLWDRNRQLSLAGRACLALAQRLGATAVTADRAWSRVRNVSVHVIR